MKISTQQTVVVVAMIASAMITGVGLAASQPQATAHQSDPSAGALIRRLAAHYSKLSSLQVNVDASMTMVMNGKKQTAPTREFLALQRPDQYAYSIILRASGPGGKPAPQLVQGTLNDGRKTVNYSGTLNQYTNAPATSLAAFAAQNAKKSQLMTAPALLLSLFADSPTGQATQKLMGDGRMIGRKKLRGTPVVVFEFGYSHLNSVYNDAPKGAKYFLAFDVNRDRLVQATTIYPFSSGDVTTMTEAVRPASVNQSLPASLFTFQPPADAKLVDKFQAPPASGAGDTAAKTAAQMIGKPAPDFSLKDTAGKTVDLNSLKGRTILMDFSASW